MVLTRYDALHAVIPEAQQQQQQQQNRQAWLKAKYYLRVALVASAGSNKVAPSREWHYDFS